MSKVCLRFWLVLSAALCAGAVWCQDVYRIRLDQPIHPITSEYVVQSIQTANARGARLIILDVDTPGGYVTSVEKIERAILESRAPVVAYVTPSGARAASGGAFVCLACDLIAMAPGTSIGAAHPISGMPIPIPTAPPQAPGQEEKGGQPKQREAEVAMEKVVNDLAAHMRSMATNRHRNPELAEKMVRESISLTEQEALKGGVIELVAKDEADLLAQLAGRPLRRFDGTEVSIRPSPTAPPVDLPMSARQRFLSALADPNLAYVLFLLGVLGLFVEFKNPGLIFPGVLGGIFLLLYLMSIPLLPVNVVGLLLIALAFVFFILEVKVVSYGILAIGGVIALVIGSLMLYSGGPIPELRLKMLVALPVALAFAAIVVFLVTLAAKAYKNPVVTGKEGMVGQEGQVREAIRPPEAGKVFVFGEYWNAVSEEPLEPGEKVKVLGQEGMLLRVARLSVGGPHDGA